MSQNEIILEKLQAVLDASPATNEQKQKLLLDGITALAPAAASQAAQSAGGDFFKILMELLIQFLPILLKLLAG